MACAELAACLLRGFGFGVESEGIWMVAVNGKFAYMVVPECCGIKSMLVLAGLALYYGFLELKRPPHAVWLAVWSMPVAFGANLLRILSVAAAAHEWGETASEIVHALSAFATFPVALAVVLWLAKKFPRRRGACCFDVLRI